MIDDELFHARLKILAIRYWLYKINLTCKLSYEASQVVHMALDVWCREDFQYISRSACGYLLMMICKCSFVGIDQP